MDREAWKTWVRRKIRNVYNTFINLKPRPRPQLTGLPELNAIREKSVTRSVLNEHLETLFLESLTLQPRLIVELGVGRGGSTQVFAAVARLCGARLVSVDINDCSKALDWPEWHFVQADDLEFAGRFPAWCREHELEPRIDVLFIDTSHLYEHTRAEIEVYFPYLAPHAKVFFHDTNINHFFFRKDGSLDLAWDNQRGVIRALEGYFHKKFNEKTEFVEFLPPWLIRHHPHCCGLTVLEKLGGIFPAQV
jgi:hypothetical protein